MKVVSKVSEDAEYLMDSAADATQEAISWTLKLYQCLVLVVCCFLLWGSFRWAKSIGITQHLTNVEPSGAQDSAALFARHGDWLTESKVRSAARNPKGAFNIASVSLNIQGMPDGEGLDEADRKYWKVME
jgi:hypothetical protein